VRPLILFAHGAGAPSASGWMSGWARRLAVVGGVVTFDYPYMRAGRKTPDRQPALIAAHRAALADARAHRIGPGPVVLAGKSMGSRIGCHVAVEAPEDVSALICFGYPLRGPGGGLRDAVLLALRTPILFVQGTRDPLCRLTELDAVRARMAAPSALHVAEEGDHSLVVSKKGLAARGESQEVVDGRVLDAIRSFLATV